MSSKPIVVAKGTVHTVACPFVRETYVPPNPDESDRPTWRPGVEWADDGADGSNAVADGSGLVVYHVVDVHPLPKPYPTRVFFTRTWIDPDGKEFGRRGLRMMTLAAFRRRLVAYKFAGSDEGRFIVRKGPLANKDWFEKRAKIEGDLDPTTGASGPNHMREE